MFVITYAINRTPDNDVDPEIRKFEESYKTEEEVKFRLGEIDQSPGVYQDVSVEVAE